MPCGGGINGGMPPGGGIGGGIVPGGGGMPGMGGIGGGPPGGIGIGPVNKQNLDEKVYQQKIQCQIIMQINLS